MSWIQALPLIGDIIDKVIPDKEAAARAKLEMLKLEQEGRLKEIEQKLSVILAEARSEDPWTSRARPSFLYVVYIMLLWSLPMGFASVFYPDSVDAFTHGFRAWLGAIPDSVTSLFGAVMLGYVGGRSWEKVTKTKAGNK